MQTPEQIAKCRGLLPDISAKDINSANVDFDELPSDVSFPICGHPDEVDLEIAYHQEPGELAEQLGLSLEGCKELIDSMRRMAEATGNGAYPHSCNSAYPGVHSVSYFDGPTSWPTHLQRTLTDVEFQSIIDAKVWGPSGDPNGTPFTMSELKSVWGNSPLNQVVNDFVEETYRRWGVILYPSTDGENGQHNIHVTYPVIAGSVIGVGWFPGDDPCPGDHVNLHIDQTYKAGFQDQVGLKGHEKGHTLGLPHEFSGQESHQEPMSYRYRNHLYVGFSDGSPVFGLPKAPSIKLLTKFYGGKPEGIPWKGKFMDNPVPIPPVVPVPAGNTITLNIDGVVTTYLVTKTVVTTPVDDGPIVHH